jgi:alkaline phosphatase D
MCPDRRRREFLRATSLILAAPALALSACARARVSADPFTLGVASGSPLPDGVVLWTRLAPDPLHGGGLPPRAANVEWELAADENFRTIVRRGVATAEPHYAHSVHVEANGLGPDRWYWYRFMRGDAVSPVGRTRTAPRTEALGDWRFAFASCQQYEQGYYAALRHMADEDLDLVVFLGDYIYESSWGRNHVRAHEAGEPSTLEQYRNRYARYKSDPDLQRCHARFPWIVTWDDHEVSNDYANDRSEKLESNFLARRAAAYQAYYEHMPLRASARPRGAQMRLYGHYDFGRLARFYLLDDRQYRSHQACPRFGRGGSNTVEVCAERMQEDRTLLGFEQEAWLRARFADSPARWNIVAQQTLMAQFDRAIDGNPRFWTDGWDGYPAARRRLLASLVEQRTANPIVIGGDIHANVVSDLKLDFDGLRAATVATEFCGTSITSEGARQSYYDNRRARNPHVKLARSDKRGYTTVHLSLDQARAHLRAIDNETDPRTAIGTLARFTVANGTPGAIPD